MTNNTVTVIVSSKYLRINEIHDIRERFIILVVYTIFVGIQLKEYGIPLTIGIRNPSSTDKKSAVEYLAMNPESTAWNPESKTVLDYFGRR